MHIKPNFQNTQKKAKRPNNICAAKLLKTAKFSQFGRKKVKFPALA